MLYFLNRYKSTLEAVALLNTDRAEAFQVLVQVESQSVPPPAPAVGTIHFLGQKVLKLLHGFLSQRKKLIRRVRTKNTHDIGNVYLQSISFHPKRSGPELPEASLLFTQVPCQHEHCRTFSANQANGPRATQDAV